MVGGRRSRSGVQEGPGVLSADHEEAQRETRYVLGGSMWPLLRGIVAGPIRFMRAVRASQRFSPPGLRQRLKHLAYAAESVVLRGIMREVGVDHVHVHMANNGAMVALLATRFDRNLSYSLTIHGSAEFYDVANLRLREKAENAKFVRCISDYCRSQVMICCDSDDWDRLHVVHCGVDTDMFRPAPAPAPALAPGGGPIRLVTVGRMVPIKGYTLLLRACRRLLDEGLDLRLEMVGDGPLRSELEALASTLNLERHVSFAGPVGQDRIAAHYAQADVLVISSFMEGVPVVAMEAMAVGLPIVATRVGGIPELVEDGVSGMLVSPSSTEALVAGIPSGGRAHRDRAADGSCRPAAHHRRILDGDRRRRHGCTLPSLRRRRFASVNLDVRARRAGRTFRRSSAGYSGIIALVTEHRYCLISPCRNEAKYARRTLDTVVAQSVLPALWVIVDDGSTDETPSILAEYEARHDFIRIVRREDRGRREVGGGVIRAFQAGLDSIDVDEYRFLCKLDLDLELPPRYFELLIERMNIDANLGTCSGKAYFVDEMSGRLVSEMIGDEMSVGASKFFRVDCFKEIGGFVSEVMWDGIDCHRCRMLGWRARSWDDPDLRFIHLRPRGSSSHGILTGRMRHGAGQWFMGSSFLFMTASAIYRMTRPPRVVGGAAMWWGYVKSMLGRRPRYQDREFRHFLRRYQRLSLVRGKRWAADRVLRARSPSVS